MKLIATATPSGQRRPPERSFKIMIFKKSRQSDSRYTCFLLNTQQTRHCTTINTAQMTSAGISQTPIYISKQSHITNQRDRVIFLCFWAIFNKTYDNRAAQNRLPEKVLNSVRPKSTILSIISEYPRTENAKNTWCNPCSPKICRITISHRRQRK